GGLIAALLQRRFESPGTRLAGLVQRVLDVGLHLLGRLSIDPEYDLAEKSAPPAIRHRLRIPPGFALSAATRRRACYTGARPRSPSSRPPGRACGPAH